jgi:hypothetical protein
LQCAFKSEKLLANIEQILKRHQDVADAGANNNDLSDLPIVVYLGYSIHGEMKIQPELALQLH